MGTRYKRSEQFLEKVLELIPLGSQTFSKSLTQFPHGVSPYFIERGKGAYVWDMDGNKYLDCINALAAVSVGYCSPYVDQKVSEQLKKGVSFSLAADLEYKLAKKLVQHIPSAEMVRFGKNGSDATSGAIRIARAVTGRDKVLVCGYHGWQDWYIGSTTRNLGVPKVVSDLTHHFQYNDLKSLEALLEKHKGEVAAVMMEPMNVAYPEEGFLEGCKLLAHKYGALFIFDETITGFRFSIGGAQAYFGVTPDLSTFGKGLGNGYPISVLVGKKEYMEVIQDIFLSSTFGGETISLAASLAVIEELEKHNGFEKFKRIGDEIIKNTRDLIKANSLDQVFAVQGHPSWSFIMMKDTEAYSSWEIKTLWIQECLKRGLLSLGTHNLSLAFGEEEVVYIKEVYSEVLPIVSDAIEKKTLYEQLNCKPLKPLFTVR